MSDGANHQGVVAEVAEYRYQSLDDLLRRGRAAAGYPLILALDALEDPQNFGTLLRTADAVGATGTLIPLHRAAGVTPAVLKSSAGAAEYLPIARVTNLTRALEELKRQGYWVVGLDAQGRGYYDRFPVDSPLVLVVGAEGKGLGRLVRETCDLLVRLPMVGHVGSLNAAVAGSIVLYDVFRRRGFGGEAPHP
jgi:23S rRNA (guanosine2251-2'-O)-methyltransferase